MMSLTVNCLQASTKNALRNDKIIGYKSCDFVKIEIIWSRA